MLYEGGYEIREINPPVSGMNQNISDNILPPQFCYYMENILSNPLGEARVRYGTNLIFDENNPNYSIIRAFPFRTRQGNRQIIRYGQQYILFENAISKRIIDQNTIEINSNHNDLFVKDSYIKLQYNLGGILYPLSYYFILDIITVDEITIRIKVEDNSFASPVPPEGYPIVSLYYPSGILDVFDLKTNQVVDGQTIENLSVTCVPRGEFIDSKYFICNGVDPIMTWDGNIIRVYKEYVKEFANTFRRIDDNNFSFTSNASFIRNKYLPGTGINIKVDGQTSQNIVEDINIQGNIITITTENNLPAFGGQSRVELFYSDSPPPFSFLKAVNDRLFALGPGAVGNEYRDSFNSLRFYATYTTSTDINGLRFFSEVTKTVPSTNLAGKHGGADNIEAIGYISQNIVFIGRNKTQVWQGIDPTTANLPNSLSHLTTLPVGIAHGDLLIDLPNDLTFISSTGSYVTLSTLNIAKQLAATSLNAINPLINEYIKSIEGSNFNYRACRSFKYNSGSFAGFKIGFNNILVSKYETQFYAWSVFSGDFSKSHDFVSDLDSSLYLFIDDKIFQYADGAESQVNYGDNNGSELINYAITWPINNKRRWCNKRYEIQANYSSSVVVNNKNYANIVISGDLSKTFTLENRYNFDFKGDVLGNIKLAPGINPEDLPEGSLGLNLDSPYSFHKDRLHFIGLNFYVSLIGQAMNGPLSFKKIRLFGIAER